MKKSFFLYPTTNGDIVLSGYPSWVRHSNVYPFRLYTFLLDEHSSQRIGEKSVTLITPEADSKFVTFGRTFNLGSRWVSYRNQTPDPKIVGLIECKSENDMLSLEYQIRHHDFQGAAHRDEWLYHTPEVKAFYEARTNVNIEEHLSDAIERQLQHRRAYRQRPDVKKRRHQRKREYRQRPDVKERRQRSDVKERQREYNQRYEAKKKRTSS